MKLYLIVFSFFITTILAAQTEMDAIMMNKNLFCFGAAYSNTSWKNYWEGSLKRENLNLGKVSTQTFMPMGNYGITNKLNLLFTLPYIKTNASAGQLAGQKGWQDASLFIKWVGTQQKIKGGILSGIIIAGATTPTSNYTPDLLPLSIGLKSKAVQLKLMADYLKNNWFATISAMYMYRGNVTLDRNTYYTTQLNYSNKVLMPNVASLNFRAGYRSSKLIAEAVLNQWNTLGGFDITRNNMPFVSNKMNATTIGLHSKFELPYIKNLFLQVDAATTLAGRNMGQNNLLGAGFLYIKDFNRKSTIKSN
jgi:hypothetical protein